MTNEQMNTDYPCLIVKKCGKVDEFCNLYRASMILGRSMKSIYDMLESYGGNWRTMSFEIQIEDEVSRMRRSK